jgi:hypothetical protein
METVIVVLTWIGLLVVAVCSGLTLFIWCAWCWEQALERGCRMLGIIHATIYYCGIVLRIDRKTSREAAGKVLWARYANLRQHEPEIAAEFERQMSLSAQAGESEQ